MFRQLYVYGMSLPMSFLDPAFLLLIFHSFLLPDPPKCVAEWSKSEMESIWASVSDRYVVCSPALVSFCCFGS